MCVRYPVIILVGYDSHWIEHVDGSFQLNIDHVVVGFNLMTDQLVEMFAFKVRPDECPGFFDIISYAVFEFLGRVD